MADLLVSASTGAMGSLLGKLGTMLSDEYKLLKGVRDDIKFLKAELEAMQVFLIVMAEEEKPDKQAKLRADAVREMSYEIEDNIDKFMILVEHEYCVLDLQNCVGLENHHVKDIERLFQLRYLNISWSRITELPGQIGDLKYLETLDASDTKLVELPKSVTRLKRLARLFVPDTIKYPDGIGDMENLQEFGNDISIFNQSLNFLEELGKLTNLRKLCINWVSFHESDEERYKEKRKSIVSSLCKLDKCKLRDLSIIFWLTEKDATFIAHPFFPALKSIRQINLYTGQLCWITKWMLSLVNPLCLNSGCSLAASSAEDFNSCVPLRSDTVLGS